MFVMFNTIFIIAIILEIVITYFLISKLILANKKIEKLHKSLILNYCLFVEANKKIKEGVKKLNKFIAFFTNKKFIMFKNIIKYSITFFQYYYLIKSIRNSKGLKKIFSFKNIKKIMILKAAIEILKNFAIKC